MRLVHLLVLRRGLKQGPPLSGTHRRTKGASRGMITGQCSRANFRKVPFESEVQKRNADNIPRTCEGNGRGGVDRAMSSRDGARVVRAVRVNVYSRIPRLWRRSKEIRGFLEPAGRVAKTGVATEASRSSSPSDSEGGWGADLRTCTSWAPACKNICLSGSK